MAGGPESRRDNPWATWRSHARGQWTISVPDNGGLARSNLQYHRRRPVPDREIRRLIVADTISDIHPRSRGTYAGATPPATARSYWIAVRLMELRGERATLGLLASLGTVGDYCLRHLLGPHQVELLNTHRLGDRHGTGRRDGRLHRQLLQRGSDATAIRQSMRRSWISTNFGSQLA